MKRKSETHSKIEKLIKSNPKVDTVQLEELLRMLGELEAQGVGAGEGYNLTSPFATPTTLSPEVTNANEPESKDDCPGPKFEIMR